MNSFLAIDFGAKTAGTTAIAWLEEGRLQLAQSAPKQDADSWLRQQIQQLQPQALYIDAPLSLPLAYRQATDAPDFHYRACDRAVGAMSTLFLGGLTARAMQLVHEVDIPAYEVYPKMAGHAIAKDWYHKKNGDTLAAFTEVLHTHLPYPGPPPANWHQADALLAWYIGWKHQQGKADCVGDAQEGVIWH